MVQYETVHIPQVDEMNILLGAHMLDVSSHCAISFITPDLNYEGAVVSSGWFHCLRLEFLCQLSTTKAGKI